MNGSTFLKHVPSPLLGNRVNKPNTVPQQNAGRPHEGHPVRASAGLLCAVAEGRAEARGREGGCGPVLPTVVQE